MATLPDICHFRPVTVRATVVCDSEQISINAREGDVVEEEDMASSNLMSPRAGGLAANPFHLLQREMNRLFEDVFHSDFALPIPGGNGDAAMLMPRLEVRETERELRVIAELPGVAETDIDVALDDDVLTIRGEKKLERKETQEN